MPDSLHMRRCHVCFEVSESDHDIAKCVSCGKSLLPFYYFDKSNVAAFTDGGLRPENDRDQTSGYGPIRGLTADW